jgi:hypothetical protein
MKSYLGIEWSYTINEKFNENGKIVFKPVRYHLTPQQIFTRLKYDMRVIHSDIWVNLFFNTLRHDSMVASVRYPNEADAIISRGGTVIRVNNPENTSPITKEDALMNNYDCSHQIEMKGGRVQNIGEFFDLLR